MDPQSIMKAVVARLPGAGIALATVIIGYAVIHICNKLVSRFFDKVDFDQTLEIFIQRVIKFILWIVLIITVLANLGFNVTAFIAGLSIGGFIIGFATKDVLSNLAAGLFILVNKPLRVGENVEVAGIKGNVRSVNLSDCVIITENKEFVTIPNTRIWGAPIKNFSRLK